MNPQSIGFLSFCVVVLTANGLLQRFSVRWQNGLLLLASYVFYAMADWVMLFLMVGMSVVYWWLGGLLKRLMNKGRTADASRLTTFSVCIAICLLCYFKYLGYFVEQVGCLLQMFGIHSSLSLSILLPLGLSFYTFKLISYIIEIHREHIEPCDNLMTFSLYISFFPTVMAGPIDRSGTFLPQLKKTRRVDADALIQGAKTMLWGYFLKICIADPLSLATDETWNTFDSLPASTVLAAALIYPIQMYADFCGYSCIAIGLGRMLGLVVTENFNRPFLARNVAEYWRRWHMSLTNWLTDYVFMPLNITWREYGNRGIMLAIIVNMIVVGIWHGANWTYLLFGLYHGLLFLPLIYSGTFTRKKKLKPGKWGLPTLHDGMYIVGTYLLVTIGFVAFRAPDVGSIFGFLGAIFDSSIMEIPHIPQFRLLYLAFIAILLVNDWIYRDSPSPLHFKGTGLFRYRLVRWFIYYLLLFAIYIYSDAESQQFIYVQF
ncbi:MAG: hypothetical protein K6E52_01655 [Bacteroidaceae bacterium]|nr:hypothetical protein [Bacteroidaceae bacterium]